MQPNTLPSPVGSLILLKHAPGEGVCICIAIAPAGVAPVRFGVDPPTEGVMEGVIEGVMEGVPPKRWLDGVSSQRLRRFPPPGVGVAPTPSTVSPLSVRGVSAQPPPKWLGVSPLSVLGVSSQRFLFPGVRAPGVTPPGVASHTLELGVTPGVSPPFLPGVSSQRLADGVLCTSQQNKPFHRTSP